MTTTTGTPLPPSLGPWAAELGWLDPGVAMALGPLIHRLDELVGRHCRTSEHAGEPDGYAGITSRGQPHRLLASQWLLAQEAPSEFIRRASTGELLYLSPGQRHHVDAGASALLLDCGPGQQGSARLVHLALAIVLHRRATGAGQAFRLGILTEPPGAWPSGDLPALLEHWLLARSCAPCHAKDVDGWLDHVDRPDDTWVVTSEALGRQLSSPGPHLGEAYDVGAQRLARTVTVRETGWTDSGATALVVGLFGESVHLPVPDTPSAIRLLRGQGWRRRRRHHCPRAPNQAGSAYPAGTACSSSGALKRRS